jgi:hypothetical protein
MIALFYMSKVCFSVPVRRLRSSVLFRAGHSRIHIRKYSPLLRCMLSYNDILDSNCKVDIFSSIHSFKHEVRTTLFWSVDLSFMFCILIILWYIYYTALMSMMLCNHLLYMLYWLYIIVYVPMYIYCYIYYCILLLLLLNSFMFLLYMEPVNGTCCARWFS